ncbi:MAG: DUF3352 domain-containing protein [Solirubrobacteraceae bacterium]
MLVVALALAGCGGSSSGSNLNAARTTEYSYFPAGTPFVISLATNPIASSIKRAQALEGRFPLAAFGQSALMSKLSQLGINYQSDIRPLFGNPITIGATTPTLSGAATKQFLVTWVTKDASKLTALVKKIPGVRASGSHDGASLYAAGRSATVAVSGATLVFAPDAAVVNAALDRHAHASGLSSAEVARETAGLPQDTLLETFGNLSAVLSMPSAAKARQVRWVAALRGYGAAISATTAGITFRYHLDTSGTSLTSSQLPFATGSAAPSLISTAPISVGIHDPAQIFAFAEGAEQASNPVKYSAFLKRQAAVKSKSGIDLNGFLKLLTGDLVLASDTHTTIGRVAVSNPSAAADALSKLVANPSALFAKATAVKKLAGGVYAVKEAKRTIDLGVIGNQFVAGNTGPAQLRAFAVAPATPAAGAQGAVAFRVGLSQVLHLALKHAPPQIVQTILASLGDLTGWSSASANGINGSATLALR